MVAEEQPLHTDYQEWDPTLDYIQDPNEPNTRYTLSATGDWVEWWHRQDSGWLQCID